MKKVVIIIVLAVVVLLLLVLQVFGIGFHSLYETQWNDGRISYDIVPRPHFDLDKQKLVSHKVFFLGSRTSRCSNFWSCSYSTSVWLTLYDSEIVVSDDCKIYYLEKEFNMADHYYKIVCLVEDNYDYCENKATVEKIGDSGFIHGRTDDNSEGCRGNWSTSVIPNDPNVEFGKIHSVEKWIESGIDMPTVEESVKDLIAKS